MEWHFLHLETKWTTTISMNLYTDASGTLGWGAYWSGRWLQARWSLNDCKKDIVWKELLPLQPQSTAGAITGGKRRCFSTATTSLSVISGTGVPLDHQKSWP